ncbi:hypothetical protein H2199_002218 [Coniosporium tulheliwenetii]|uniref:Uncharacterized protein n=1 Tax=Coniosporium tulheliwenetii TaxID=3383036 RepID=A0ACC2ZI93_9PEZI|nr:hypothetical protein H2199_002218 [Cladosporium sp. JES 115]
MAFAIFEILGALIITIFFGVLFSAAPSRRDIDAFVAARRPALEDALFIMLMKLWSAFVEQYLRAITDALLSPDLILFIYEQTERSSPLRHMTVEAADEQTAPSGDFRSGRGNLWSCHGEFLTDYLNYQTMGAHTG